MYNENISIGVKNKRNKLVYCFVGSMLYGMKFLLHPAVMLSRVRIKYSRVYIHQMLMINYYVECVAFTELSRR